MRVCTRIVALGAGVAASSAWIATIWKSTVSSFEKTASDLRHSARNASFPNTVWFQNCVGRSPGEVRAHYTFDTCCFLRRVQKLCAPAGQNYANPVAINFGWVGIVFRSDFLQHRLERERLSIFGMDVEVGRREGPWRILEGGERPAKPRRKKRQRRALAILQKFASG